MSENAGNQVDHFLPESLLFIASTVIDGASYYAFQLVDGTQSFYAVETDEDKRKMVEGIHSGLRNCTTYIRFFETYINTEHLKSVEMEDDEHGEPRLVFLFRAGVKFTQEYKNRALMLAHRDVFLEMWAGMKRPPQGTATRHVLH